MTIRIAALLLVPLAGWGADWNAALAARYLDGRAAEWAAWPRAAKEGGPCVSCHTTLGYLMARPALRRALGESAATEFENGLLAGVKVRAAKPPDTTASGTTQAVIAALVLAQDDARRGKGMSAAAENAFRVMWETQRREEPNRGAWGWTSANLEPWEVPESVYFGAALAAVATSVAPDDYQSRPDIQPNVALLQAYLKHNRAEQPLANQIQLLWANARMKGLLTDEQRQALIAEIGGKLNRDGGWSMAALGPWRPRPEAPAPVDTPASSAYATAWTAFVLEEAGQTPTKNTAVRRAVEWLRAHQATDGSWDAMSMNHRYEPGSMPEKFMRDAATAYAVLALGPLE